MADAERKSVSRRSLIELRKSVPLLKFTEHEKGTLEKAGIDKIKMIPPGGKICPVIFIGDGRGGKSYLASRLAGDEDSFVSTDTAEPVTEGIDIVILPMPKVLEQCGMPPGPGEDEWLLILDCEGGNNALAAIRMLVNVFGIVIGTQIVFVASGMASEQALQMLSASLAAVSLIKLSDSCSKPFDRELHFVVNKNTLRYKDDALETMLTADQNDEQRKAMRQSILDEFDRRKFHVIPMMGMPDFEEQVAKLRKVIISTRKPFEMGNTPVNGPTLAGLLEVIVKEMHKANEVSFPSMHRYVIFDGFLIPLADRMAQEYEESLPKITDWDPHLATKNSKDAVVKKYGEDVAYIGQQSLISEARCKLLEKLDSIWEKLARTNDAFGDQVRDTETETRETETERNAGPIGGRGLLQRVVVTMMRMQVEGRTVIHRKRGGEPERGPWANTGSTTTRIVESAFETYGILPTLRGKLQKKSPNILRLIRKSQERVCILKEGHFLWWGAENLASRGEASGCINFLVNRAVVEKDSWDRSSFKIYPADASGWADLSCFSGGPKREFLFDATECDIDIDVWVKGIQAHIEFASEAFKQLGVGKVNAQVLNGKPTLQNVER